MMLPCYRRRVGRSPSSTSPQRKSKAAVSQGNVVIADIGVVRRPKSATAKVWLSCQLEAMLDSFATKRNFLPISKATGLDGYGTTWTHEPIPRQRPRKESQASTAGWETTRQRSRNSACVPRMRLSMGWLRRKSTTMPKLLLRGSFDRHRRPILRP